MLYLKNSLVNLTIILFYLFFLTILSAEESNFIFPKKKTITTKISENKQGKIEISKNLKSDNLPKKNPFTKTLSKQKNLKTNKKTTAITKKSIVKINLLLLNCHKENLSPKIIL